MEDLHKYVPATVIQGTYLDSCGVEKEAVVEKFHYILLGGDQLTASRARGSQRIRRNSRTPRGRIEGFCPIVEDWHAKGILMTLSCTE